MLSVFFLALFFAALLFSSTSCVSYLWNKIGATPSSAMRHEYCVNASDDAPTTTPALRVSMLGSDKPDPLTMATPKIKAQPSASHESLRRGRVCHGMVWRGGLR